MPSRSRRTIDTPRQLRNAIAKLSPSSPVTNRFTKRWLQLPDKEARQRERPAVWYDTQHEHWMGWLGAYNGPGAYNRKRWKRDAAYVYNHINNPQMLIYLAEAINVDRALVTKAVKAALVKYDSMPAMCAAVRNVIPWSIAEAALHVRANV